MKNKTPPFFFSLVLMVICFGVSSCSGLFYHPTSLQYTTPDKFKIQSESFFFPSQTKKQEILLHGLHLKHSSATPLSQPKSTVLFFHGNAQNLSGHFLFPAWMTQFGHDIFIFDYRGYGKSQGIPNQKGTYEDALAALDFAYKLHLKNKADKFIVYGHSLGGVIAMRAIEDFPFKDKIDLVVMESSFLSYQGIAFKKMTQIWFLWPLSPLAFVLVSDEMSAEDSVAKLSPIPLLVIYGTHDEVVPSSLGEEIFQKALPPKWVWPVEGGDHDHIFHGHPQSQEYRKKLLKFFDELPSRKGP